MTAAKAQVAQAELNLSFTKVRSMVDGVAGIAKAQVGDLVGPTTVLTTVSQVEPIKAYFAISKQEYLRFARRISDVAEGRRSPGGQKNLELVLSDGSLYPARARCYSLIARWMLRPAPFEWQESSRIRVESCDPGCLGAFVPSNLEQYCHSNALCCRVCVRSPFRASAAHYGSGDGGSRRCHGSNYDSIGRVDHRHRTKFLHRTHASIL